MEPQPINEDVISTEIIDILKDYPKIQNYITENWGTLRLRDYFDFLLTDTETVNGPRAGFSLEVADAILSLSLAHLFILEQNGLVKEDNWPSPKEFAITKWDLPKNF
jgi:hypothetical protein